MIHFHSPYVPIMDYKHPLTKHPKTMYTGLVIGGPDHGGRRVANRNILEAVLPNRKDIKNCRTIFYYWFEDSEFGPVFVLEDLLKDFFYNHHEEYGYWPTPCPETAKKIHNNPAFI